MEERKPFDKLGTTVGPGLTIVAGAAIWSDADPGQAEK
jgi:hypothetical protein